MKMPVNRLRVEPLDEAGARELLGEYVRGLSLRYGAREVGALEAWLLNLLHASPAKVVPRFGHDGGFYLALLLEQYSTSAIPHWLEVPLLGHLVKDEAAEVQRVERLVLPVPGGPSRARARAREEVNLSSQRVTV